MNEEVKKLLESVETFDQIKISMLSVTTEFVRKSDFDRIVKVLCDENKNLRDVVMINRLRDSMNEPLI